MTHFILNLIISKAPKTEPVYDEKNAVQLNLVKRDKIAGNWKEIIEKLVSYF